MNRKMKKSLAAVLCGLICFGSLTACSQKQKESPAPAAASAVTETEPAEEQVSWEDLYSRGLDELTAGEYDEMAMYSRYDYDENGNLLQQNNYNPDGTLIRVIKPSDE